MRVPEWRDGEPAKGLLAPPVGKSIFDGAVSFPIMVLDGAAVRHNVATMAAFARDHGLLLAPHAKTTMAPALLAAQLDAGAWGFTVATPTQALTLRGFGVRRIVLANQFVDPAGLRAVAAELERDPAFEFLCFADSVAGIEILSAAAGPRPFRVLAELGHEGGRAGCRTLGGLLDVATAAQNAPGVELAGVAGYEGALRTAAEVRAYLGRLQEALEHLRVREPILSAGGSQWFDVIGRELAGCRARVVLRSGAYVTHDDGYYRERTPFTRVPGELRPALELWAHVLSAPEPGMAVLGFGKRDAPYDEGLPVVRALRRHGRTVALGEGEVTVTKMQDQHAIVRTAAELRPGDLLSFGISHPCTAFDKWRVLPVVDDRHVVIDLISTYL
ncbi:D-serine deaminase-like pyridoxal phosphate-dependent protein [Thermocatellispora tengchongensis]|uniref:D-serine deaminase-like pyridoxal phosphate-dependent protein n=1 Tax=Thermocatellispora tengchongensis TaxID=1073253 RepID=A0A840PAG9_9ACTN|nr:alanine racemase [Thermocatellispora tengchongensis]MBB5134923.1 D-serine deaminase-like pyridoxal phosphate-dependent protein [Thermocatellispora tengchongensis]